MERSFRTIKDTWLNGFDASTVSSLKELNVLLADYVRKRNTSVNRTISETPLARYQRGMSHIKLPKSKAWLHECFMNRIKRKVRLDSTIFIDKISYDVPMQFIRATVVIYFLPDKMEDAYILFEDEKFPIRKTNRIENGKTKRNNEHAIDYSKLGGTNNV